MPGTQHFRNILRHDVQTDPAVLSLRVDESLYFANARFLEDYVSNRVVGDTVLRHVILMCSAINEIDLSAVESLEAINLRLSEMGVTLHLSEVKGPVMDRLQRGHFLDQLTGKVYLSQYDAFRSATGQGAAAARVHRAAVLPASIRRPCSRVRLKTTRYPCRAAPGSR